MTTKSATQAPSSNWLALQKAQLTTHTLISLPFVLTYHFILMDRKLDGQKTVNTEGNGENWTIPPPTPGLPLWPPLLLHAPLSRLQPRLQGHLVPALGLQSPHYHQALIPPSSPIARPRTTNP